MTTRTLIESFMSVFGALSSGVLLPAIVRLYRRKSSNDYSLWSEGFGVAAQIIWLAYAIYAVIPCMIAAGAAWLLLLTTQFILVLRYRRND